MITSENMKLAIFGDLHLGIRQNSTDWHDIAYEWCDTFVEELSKRNIHDIVFLGDFFHNRNTISVNTLNAANVFLSKLKNFNVHMILGNHDLFYDSEYTTSAVSLFDNFENIVVYSQPKLVKLGSKQVMMCGWGYDMLAYNADVLFTHAEFATFKTNQKCSEREEGISVADVLRHYPLVYSGHYHMRQSKSYDRGEVRYVGNPFAMDFSDERLVKGFEIYDTETGDIQFVENRVSPSYKKYKLSELIHRRDFDVLDKELFNTFVHLVIDKNITLQDVDRLMHLIGSKKPRQVSYEWENGKSFSQTIEDFEATSFDIKDTTVEYIQTLDVAEKDAIIEYIISLFNRLEESA